MQSTSPGWDLSQAVWAVARNFDDTCHTADAPIFAGPACDCAEANPATQMTTRSRQAFLIILPLEETFYTARQRSIFVSRKRLLFAKVTSFYKPLIFPA
jgi:hypothetical protein